MAATSLSFLGIFLLSHIRLIQSQAEQRDLPVVLLRAMVCAHPPEHDLRACLPHGMRYLVNLTV